MLVPFQPLAQLSAVEHICREIGYMGERSGSGSGGSGRDALWHTKGHSASQRKLFQRLKSSFWSASCDLWERSTKCKKRKMIAWSLLKCQNRCVALSIKGSVNITADRQSFISLSYQEYPCGVFLRAWNQWGLGSGLTKAAKKKKKNPLPNFYHSQNVCKHLCCF